MQHTVIGMFSSNEDAQRAAERLRSGGFSEHEVDVSAASARTTLDSDRDTPYSVSDESRYDQTTGSYTTTNSDTLNEDRIEERKHRHDDRDEGFGESIGRFFRNLFDNEEEAEKYSTVARNSSIVTVFASSSEQAERAREILDEAGAIDVDENAGRTRSYSDTSDSTRVNPDYETRNDLTAEGVTDKTIPVIEENINIGKREVESGGARVRARIVERPVEENLRLREERVYVERNPVNRPATDRDFDTFREGEIEMTETSEVPIVNKEARVVEEVRLNKEVNERDETVRDTVRKTEVDVEKLDEETLKTKRGRNKR